MRPAPPRRLTASTLCPSLMKPHQYLIIAPFLAAIAPPALASTQGDSAPPVPVLSVGDVQQRSTTALIPFDLNPATEKPELEAPAAIQVPQPHGQLLFQSEGDALWARGRTYKASASDDGFAYYPYLGMAAERGYPVRFRLAGMTAGGESITFSEQPKVTRNGPQFVLDRGSVSVRYDLALDSVEQSFTLEQVGLSGELVLTLDVESDLESRPMDGGGFRFDGPEGGVDYGSAIAFDEAGHVTSVDAVLVGDTLRLVVPPAFVNEAQGRITVDPIVTTFSVNDNTTFSYLEPDVTYDRTNNVFLYVYEELFTVTDVDLYYTVVDSSGVFVRQGYVLIGPEDCSDPEAANLAVSDQCLVVCSRSLPAGGSEIVGRIYDATAGTFGLELTIYRPTNETLSCLKPDVGGGAANDPASRFLVVWSNEVSATESNANLRGVGQDGTLGTRFQVEMAPGFETEVVVGASIGTDLATGFWPIIVRREDATTGDVTLRGARMRASGLSYFEPVFEVYTPPAGIDLTDIDVSSALSIGTAAPTYLATYVQQGPGDEDVFLLVMREAERRNRIELALIEHGPKERNHILPRLSTTREDFVVTYLEQRPGTLVLDPYVSVVDLIEEDFLAVSEQRTLIGEGGALFSGGAAPASRFDGGLTTSRVNHFAWSRFETIAGESAWNVYGVRHTGSNPEVAGPQYCFGNPNSTGERGFLAVYGNNNTTDNKTLSALRLPPNQFGLFAVSTQPAFFPVVPNSVGALCLGGSLGRFNSQIAQADANGALEIIIDPTNLPTPTGTEAAMAGTFRQFQFWHRDVDGGMATSNFTNAVSVFFR